MGQKEVAIERGRFQDLSALCTESWLAAAAQPPWVHVLQDPGGRRLADCHDRRHRCRPGAHVHGRGQGSRQLVGSSRTAQCRDAVMLAAPRAPWDTERIPCNAGCTAASRRLHGSSPVPDVSSAARRMAAAQGQGIDTSWLVVLLGVRQLGS